MRSKKRIEEKFSELQKQKKTAFIGYICAGDPNLEISQNIFDELPKMGVDIIELGVPFLDPSGDGPTIERAAKRAIESGANLFKILEMVKSFRINDDKTPIILMSYYNPILKFGCEKFCKAASEAGVDGILIVDLPTEEEDEILPFVQSFRLDFIRLVAPHTTNERAIKVVQNASGFIYLVSMLGITGTKLADVKSNSKNFLMLKEISKLPIAIGFGIKNSTQIKEFSEMGFDGVVVGSKLVEVIEDGIKKNLDALQIISSLAKLIKELKNE